MSIIINLIVFILVLTVIVAFHEFGHFLLAKKTGVYVYEFAIGMGPKLFSKKKGETVYSIRAIPIGGFCQLAGEDTDEDDDNKVPKNRRLQNKNAWQRFLIMVFGPLNNFILAVLLLFFIALIWGGSTMNPTITTVEKGSAAEEAGLKANDTILQINHHKISTSDDISLYLAVADPEKGSTFKVEREGGTFATIKVKPKKITDEGKETYRYGIGMQQESTKGFIAAIQYVWKKTVSIFKQMFVTVGYLFTGGIKVTQLSGPVGIYSIVGQSRAGGLANVLYLMAFLSINVGFINLLPIPAFDGGHILFIVIELLKGSPVNPEVENKIHTIFLILLMILMIFITFNDVLRLF
ncbi:MAG: RIP metalloprotease RseP [Bacilli bacterium]|nr:RIP metalloprotease RseP [Bacilli bacterium]